MSQFRFTCRNGAGERYTEVQFEAETLDEILPNFEEFLRGCGYYFDGEVVIDALEVNPEDVYAGCHADCGHIHTDSQLDLFETFAEEPVVLWDEQDPDFPPMGLHIDTEGGAE